MWMISYSTPGRVLEALNWSSGWGSVKALMRRSKEIASALKAPKVLRAKGEIHQPAPVQGAS